jgi:hypothetical protein
MENVFSHAYCTIAATAAADSNAGFLMRDLRVKSVYVQDTSGNEFYVSNDIDDFDEDVGKAKLNTRAWVMQEAVLSRRIIHFSANQIYWECGEGINCENLVRLGRYDSRTATRGSFVDARPSSRYTDRYFTLDSNFPKRMLDSGHERTLNCISYLIQEYSKRDLTVPTDRLVAISALEDRIKGALNKQAGHASDPQSSRYGIFQDFLHRNLLWRADDEIEWVDSLRFDEKRTEAIIATLWVFREGVAKRRICLDLGEGDILGKQYCVVVGKMKPKPRYFVRYADEDSTNVEYHILVVVSTDVDGEYRRVGAGTVHCSHVVRQRAGVRVV